MDFPAAVPRSPEEIFPLEVWGMILENLESISDLKNCQRTCTTLTELLKPKQTNFLMPEVFPKLYKYLTTKNDYNSDGKNDRRKENAQNILNMRLVSRLWKQSVDSYYQNHPSFGKMQDLERYCDEKEPFSLLPYHFCEVEGAFRLERLLSKNFHPESNPFVTRYVRYTDGPNSRPNFMQLLKSFGSQIWHCHLQFNRGTRTQLYKLVRSFLILMPNLRSFRLAIFGITAIINVRRTKMLGLRLKQLPFPKLEYLDNCHMTNVPYPISTGILEASAKLQKLCIPACYPDGPISNQIVNVESTHLEQLAFAPYVNGDLLQMKKLTWPLSTLRVKVMHEEIKLKVLFQVLFCFRSSLENLTIIHRSDKEDNNELKTLRMDLPNLKRFKLKIPFELRTIDFLKECAALQHIELCFNTSKLDENCGNEIGDEIQFNDRLALMETSNVWNVLPTLQSININTNGMILERSEWNGRNIVHFKTKVRDRKYKFTRHQHENYCDNIKPSEEK